MSAVVVTRDEDEGGPLSALLRAGGASVLLWPAVRILPPSDPAPLERALASAAAGGFDWIVFASRHAVRAVLERLPERPAVRVAAVGERTAEALRQGGWTADVVPREASAASLLAQLAAQLAPDARVLYPASSRALPALPTGLAALGAEVSQVEAYRTEAATAERSAWRDCIGRGQVAAVTFTSPSAVEELERALGQEDFERLLDEASALALGATTGQALAARGHACVLADPATLAGLAATTLQLLKTRI